MLRFMIDLDGVCYKWDSVVSFLMNHHFGYTLPSEQPDYDYFKNTVERQHWKWLWSEGVEKGLFRHGHMYKGTAEAFDNLAGLGKLVIVSHRPKSAIVDTLGWIAYHRLPVSEIHLLTASEPKSSVVPECDLCIDDGPHIVEDLRVHTKSRVLLWDRAWNREVLTDQTVEGHPIHRVRSWLDVIQEARRLKIIEGGRAA